MRRGLLPVFAAAALATAAAQTGGSIYLRTPGNFGGGLPLGGSLGRGSFGYGYGGYAYGGYGYGGSGFLYGTRGRVPFTASPGYLNYSNLLGYGGTNNGLPLYGTSGYWLWSRINGITTGTQVPSGPSYANPTAIIAPAPIAEAIVAPSTPAGEEWTEVRTRFASVSAKLQLARTSVAEMRVRVAAMGQSIRPEIVTRLSLAESALGDASKAVEARSLTDAQSSLQRADYVTAQILKEFGR